LALLINASLMRWPDHCGCCCARIAAAPDTCGVAIDVPLMERYIPLPSGIC
jgi:hypothetical protein